MQVLIKKRRPVVKKRGEVITKEFLQSRIGNGQYAISKWIEFCLHFLDLGYKVTLTEAYNTVSKYVTVHGANDISYTVRFSNHKPNYGREVNGDCDFFVGVTHLGITTTSEAIRAAKEYLNGYDRIDGSRKSIGTVARQEQNPPQKDERIGEAGLAGQVDIPTGEALPTGIEEARGAVAEVTNLQNMAIKGTRV